MGNKNKKKKKKKKGWKGQGLFFMTVWRHNQSDHSGQPWGVEINGHTNNLNNNKEKTTGLIIKNDSEL